MVISYIGADVDCKTVDLAVEQRKVIINRYRVPTSITALRDVLRGIPGKKNLVFEEGPLAHWLYHNLKQDVDTLVVCDPRRNAYIAKDGDKDDSIDAAKLAELLRGGFLKEVYHSDDDRQVLLKRWVALYHDRVHEGVRQVNKLRGCCRHYGVRPPRSAVLDPVIRKQWIEELPDRDLQSLLAMLWPGLDMAKTQVKDCKQKLRQLSKAYRIIEYWQKLPGIGLIRATTLYAYLDTPWRFRTKTKLCKYCGVGLVRSSSGKDRFGKLKVGLLQLAWMVNKRLKDAVMGATISAISQGNNPFAVKYERLVRNGITPPNARHTVARKLLTVMWGMWKSNRPYDPGLV